MSLIALITDLIYHAEHKLYCDLRETYYLPLITIETINTPNSHLAGILDQQDLYMLMIGDLAPTLSIQTDCGYFSLTEQIGKKVVIFFFHVLTHQAAQSKLYNFLYLVMILPQKTLS